VAENSQSARGRLSHLERKTPHESPLIPARRKEGGLLWSDMVGHTRATHDSGVGFRDQVVAFEREIESLIAVQWGTP
jgi:hypothetical protein